MPRIYTSCNDPIDFCIKHFPKTEADGMKRFGHDGDGPDGRGNCFSYDASHPPYEDSDYTCYICRCPLKKADNGY
jgi:hypothetical protein